MALLTQADVNPLRLPHSFPFAERLTAVLTFLPFLAVMEWME